MSDYTMKNNKINRQKKMKKKKMVNREDQLVTTNENVMFIVDEEHNLSGVKKDIGKVLVPNRDESKVTVFTVNK